jgi:hypothetical protein
MKYLLPCALCILALSGFASIVTAQTPYLQVYFDEELTETSADCPTGEIGTVEDEFWVVAHNFNAYLAAIEFKINYPPQIYWYGEIPVTDLTLGSSPTGVAMAFPTPLNAYGPAVLMKVRFVWMCNDCYTYNVMVCFDVFPSSGYVRAVRWPDEELIYATSGTAVICGLLCAAPCGDVACPGLPGVPVAQSTWGGIKALYR